MDYRRMPIEIESPEEMGYSTIRYNLAESSVRDLPFNELNIDLSNIVLAYPEHKGSVALRTLILENSSDFTIDDVLVTTGAAMALFMIFGNCTHAKFSHFRLAVAEGLHLEIFGKGIRSFCTNTVQTD